MKKCPWCAELVQDEAIYCRYCRRDIPMNQSKQNNAPPKIEEDSVLLYEYKLDAEKINKNGKLDFEDIYILANISRESYIFPKPLLSKLSDLILVFMSEFLTPTLQHFKFLRTADEDLTEYFAFCYIYYLSMDQIFLGTAIEHLNGNFSSDEYIDFCLRVSAEIFAAVIYKTNEIEANYSVVGRNQKELADFTISKFEAIKKPFAKLTSDIMKVAITESLDTLINQTVEGQTPFYLELKRLNSCFLSVP